MLCSAAWSTRTSPCVGWMAPAKMRSKVDLPEPGRPSKPTRSPGWKVRFSSRSADWPLAYWCTSWCVAMCPRTVPTGRRRLSMTSELLACGAGKASTWASAEDSKAPCPGSDCKNGESCFMDWRNSVQRPRAISTWPTVASVRPLSIDTAISAPTVICWLKIKYDPTTSKLT